MERGVDGPVVGSVAKKGSEKAGEICYKVGRD